MRFPLAVAHSDDQLRRRLPTPQQEPGSDLFGPPAAAAAVASPPDGVRRRPPRPGAAGDNAHSRRAAHQTAVDFYGSQNDDAPQSQPESQRRQQQAAQQQQQASPPRNAPPPHHRPHPSERPVHAHFVPGSPTEALPSRGSGDDDALNAPRAFAGNGVATTTPGGGGSRDVLRLVSQMRPEECKAVLFAAAAAGLVGPGFLALGRHTPDDPLGQPASLLPALAPGLQARLAPL